MMSLRIMNDFDPDLALAELDRFAILLQHHLRRIRISKNVDAARKFNQELGKVASDAERTYREVKRGIVVVE
jgi:hypothetical protein